ncbi:MAG: protein kinase [Vicinamibacteria bacterium]|nr:protein kinase [Vicinamibacteria bacterium]
MSAALPTRIGRYVIESELGRGMMGVVYRARDPELDRPIALKTISLAFAVPEEERAAFEKRFLAEARAAAKLSHPAIVVVHDVGRDAESGALYIALEMLRGRTLEEIVRAGGPLPWPDAVRLGVRLAEALGHAHAGGVIHRDVKPANVMVIGPGEPKLMDFGVAKLSTGNLTASGETFGTPLFMSPEQALGQPIDGRADLFSLGSILYFALTARNPFAADSVPVILAKVAYDTPPPPSVLVPEIPTAVDTVVGRAMAKVPAERYPDGAALAEALRGVLRLESGRATYAGGDTMEIDPAERPLPPSSSRPALAAGAAGLLVVLAGLLWWGRAEPAAEPSPALNSEAAAPSGSPAGEGIPLQWSLASPSPAAAPGAATTNAPGPESTPAPEPATKPSPRAAAVARATPKAVAHVFVDFEHGLKEGTLRVSSGDLVLLDVVLEKPKEGKGSVQRLLDLAPGEHQLRVVLVLDEEKDKEKVEELAVVLVAGATRQLEIRYGGLFKKLTLKVK